MITPEAVPLMPDLGGSRYQLRDYQKLAVNAAKWYFGNKKLTGGSLMVLPTGSGKSLILAALAKELGKPTLIFSPSKEILEQNYDKLLSYGYRASVYSASMNSKQIGGITLATIGSVINHREDFRGFEYVLIDECHKVDSKGGMYQKFLAEHNGKILGLTATPYRLVTDGFGGSILKFLTRTRPRIFERVIHVTQNGDLFKAGYLAKLEYKHEGSFDAAQLRLNSTGADYTDESVKAYYQRTNFSDKLYSSIVNCLQSGRRNILIFTRFIEESESLVRRLGPIAEIVTGETPKRDREGIINRFRSGQTKVVSNVGVLCLDEKTEILTREGWKGIDDISYGHKVACWHPNNSITFAPPQFIIRRPRLPREAMIFSSGNAIDFRVTEDHRMIIGSGRGRQSWKEVGASSLINKRFSFPASGYADPAPIEIGDRELTSTQLNRKIICNSHNYRKKGIPKIAAKSMAVENTSRVYSKKYTQPNKLSLDDCRFIGFWLGDGSLSGHRCSFVQSFRYRSIINWFDNILVSSNLNNKKTIKMPRGFKTEIALWNIPRGCGGDGQFIEHGYYRLEPYLNKKGCDYFWGFSREQFSALMEGFWYADGEHGIGRNYKTSNKYWTISGTQKPLYDLLQAIGTCRGYRFIIRPIKQRNPRHGQQWSMGWQDRISTYIGWAKPQEEKTWRHERVWCVTSESSFIVTRRNGIVTITGNTHGFDFPELETVILGRPTMSLALYYQMIGRAIRIHPQKQSAWIVDLCDNFKLFGKVEDLFLHAPKPGAWIITSNGRQLTNIYYGDRNPAYLKKGGCNRTSQSRSN